MSSNTSKKPRVQSAARTIDILQTVAREGPLGLSAKELSDKLELPRQAVYHLVHTLVGADMLRRVGSSNYVLGFGTAALARGFRRQLAVADHFVRYTEMAADETGECAYLSGWIDGEVVVLASTRSNAPIQTAEVPLGQTGDTHARASGKLLLAMAPKDDIAIFLERHHFNRRTPNTITDAKAFAAELTNIRKDLISFDHEEWSAGLTCMAVPLGTLPAQLALSITAPTARFHERSAEYLKVLRRIASSYTSQETG